MSIFYGTDIDNCVAAGNTIDLICHGTPSPQILDSFLSDYGIRLTEIQSIRFREKNDFKLEQNGKRFTVPTISDNYLMTFLNATTYTENCYQCQYARIERSGDITLGDSWGSDLEKSIQDKGVSLVLCQNEKGKELINQTDLTLVDRRAFNLSIARGLLNSNMEKQYGIFAFENNSTNLQNKDLLSVLKDAAGIVNYICLDKDLFVKYWDAGMPRHNLHENRNYAVYRIEDLAFGYFISNLVEDIYISMHGQQIPETLRDMFYPIENTKEADRIKTIDIEEVRNLNTLGSVPTVVNLAST